MKYKLIACDLDGTLFGSDGKMSEQNSEAIKELCDLGVHFVPASGRTYSDIPPEVREHRSVRYIIYSNGAAVIDKQTGERITFCMPRDLSRSVLDLLFSTRSHVTVRRNGNTYFDAEKNDGESFSYYNVWSVHADLLLEYGSPIENFERETVEYDNVEMISAFFKSEDDLDKARKILSEDSRLNVVSACPYNLEINYKEASKGRALCALANSLSIPIEETVAMGDSENDISMLESAGLGLSMKNAKDMVKERSDEVICRNDEHAVQFVKEKFI